MATYHYVAFTDPKHIRLLSLLPGSGDDEIACDLNTAALSDHPVFEALSYTWGDATEMLPLRCGGGIVLATVNLHSALRYLRLADITRTLWVDALCSDTPLGYIREFTNTPQVLINLICKSETCRFV